MVCAFSPPSRRTLPPEVGGQTERLRPRCQLVNPPRELVEAGLEDGALGFRVRRDLQQAVAQRRLDVVRAVLERAQRLVALTLQRRAQARETLLDPLRRLVALALGDLLQVALAPAQPVCDLVQCAAAFVRVLLQVGVRLRHRLLRRGRELGAQARDQLPLLVDLPLQALGVLPDLRLDLRHQLALPRLDPPQLFGEPFLQRLDVARPVVHPLRDRLLHDGQLLAEALARVALALCDVSAPFLGDPPLFFCELREGVGTQTRQGALELFRPLCDLARHDLVERRLASLDLPPEEVLVALHLAEHEQGSEQRQNGHSRGRDRDDRPGGHAVIVSAPPRARRRARRKPT